MYAVFECSNCGEKLKNPPTIPRECKCGSKNYKLDLENSSGLPQEMIEKAKPHVIEKRVEAEEVFGEPRKTDSRGRLTLGSDYANKKIRIAVLESEEL